MKWIVKSVVLLGVFVLLTGSGWGDTAIERVAISEGDEESLKIDAYSGATPKDTLLPEADKSPVKNKINDSWFSADKFMHFGVSAAIPGLTYYAYVYRLEQDETQGKIISISLTGLIGLGKEIYDKKTKGHFSWKDLAWDALGLTAGYFLFVHQYK